MEPRSVFVGRRCAAVPPGRAAVPTLTAVREATGLAGARVIVEADYGDFVVQPSFGTHFFQNLITFSIAYLTVNSSSGSGMLDWDWLNSIEPASESGFLRHLRLEQPLEVLVDGRNGKGKLVISYNSLDELEGILQHIK